MSKGDRIKEELGWLKVVFAVAVAVDASLIAWLARSYQTIPAVLAVFGFLGVVSITAAAVWVNRPLSFEAPGHLGTDSRA